MKIFLTGGSGMVGRNILEHPAAKRHEIFSPSSQELNLLDRNEVTFHLKAFGPDIVIHSAGLVGGIQANIANPVEFLTKNLDMGLSIILSAAEVGIQNFINFGSSCMYPREAKNPLREESVLAGRLEPTNEGYALAKIAAAKLCEYIVSEDATKNYKTVIPCNLYGRHDKYDPMHSHLIPSVIHKLHAAKTEDRERVTIWGDGTARREFMYAADVADFIFFAIKNIDQMPQNINVGMGYDFSITEYYQSVAEVVGFDGGFDFDLSRPVGMKQKLVDITKLQEFGWSSKTSLKDGIARAYMFYQEELNNGV